MHQSPTPEPRPTSYLFPQTAASMPPSIAQRNTAQLANFMSAFLAAQGTPQSTTSSATSPSTTQQPSPTSPPASTPQLSPLQPQQLFGSQPVQPTPHLATHQPHQQPALASEPPVMRISGELPVGTQMLWCDGLYCGWGNHTTACQDEAMALQETHPDTRPNYSRKDGSFNPAALICNCCGKTGHQFRNCPHAENPGAAEQIAEGSFRVENKKTHTKNNVDAVNSLLAAKGVDTQTLSFNRDFNDGGTRSGNTSPPAQRPASIPSPTTQLGRVPAATPDMVTCMLQALQLFSQTHAQHPPQHQPPPLHVPNVHPPGPGSPSSHNPTSVGPTLSPVPEPIIDNSSTSSGSQSMSSIPSAASGATSEGRDSQKQA